MFSPILPVELCSTVLQYSLKKSSGDTSICLVGPKSLQVEGCKEPPLALAVSCMKILICVLYVMHAKIRKLTVCVCVCLLTATRSIDRSSCSKFPTTKLLQGRSISKFYFFLTTTTTTAVYF